MITAAAQMGAEPGECTAARAQLPRHGGRDSRNTERRGPHVGPLRVSTHAEWERWFEFFLEAVAHQARDVVARATRLQALRDDFRARVVTPRASGLLPRLVDEPFTIPAMTLGRARELLGVTHRAATLNVERLVGAGVLVELERSGVQRFFIAADIISVIEGSPPAGRPPNG
jgi:hypothetical protein